MIRIHLALCLLLCATLLARSGEAGQAGSSRPVRTAPADSRDHLPVFEGPPAPIAPEVFARDPEGRTTVRAVRVATPLRLDGLLDEAVYATVPSISDFIQAEPVAGMPASEKTEVWIFFDDEHVYVVGRCWDSHPERMLANEMRRDNGGLPNNEQFSFTFDTFRDRRNAVILEVNPIGGRMDAQVTGELATLDWNPIWEVAVKRFAGGWIVEAAVPFKSLRYRPERSQIWGLQVRRKIRWKNEIVHLTAIPKSHSGRGLSRLSLTATLVGLEAPPRSRNLEIKPYVNANLTTDLQATPQIRHDPDADVGLDVKYGITENLTADLTYNTDFAQVEADEQQVNLTRFNLLFPEKRDFFLENKGVFSFGAASAGDTPQLFYSRRIGLNQGRQVPIRAGGRLNGRLGGFNLGVLNIQTDDEPVSGSRPTNFSVVRVNRDFLRRSSIGMMATHRSVGLNNSGSNTAYGIDGMFTPTFNLNINTYWARTHTDGLRGDDTSYRAFLDYTADRYGVQVEHLAVGDNFNPEIGFLRRDDMRKSFGQFRFSPRPRSSKVVRKYSLTGSMAYIENRAGRLETRDWDGAFGIEFQNSDVLNISYNGLYEFLPRPFAIAPGVTLPVGGYEFANVLGSFSFGGQRRASASLSVEHGTFYDGHKTAVAASRGRVKLTSQFSAEPSISVNWVHLPEGSFTTTLVGSRVTYTVTPMLFVSALLQYNSGSNAFVSNVRLRWEYRPGSELFVVFNEQRDTLAPSFPELVNRAVIVKINRLLRF